MNMVNHVMKRNGISDSVCDKAHCTGCGACVLLCPLSCIDMVTDFEGFYSPKIDTTKCIGCDKCRNACPSMSKRNYRMQIPHEAYAFINGNSTILNNSSSGGAFPAISDWVFMQNGVVYSCVYDDQFNAVFCKCKTETDLAVMQGSKYVESKAWNVYHDIKNDLQNNCIVLFVGLPCQVAGLYAYLKGQEIQNLYTVDLLCHGVPSHGLFKAYLKMVEEKYGAVSQYAFRGKKYWGWGSWGYYKYQKNNKIKEKRLLVANDYYYALYFKENNYKENCYSCQYASLPRIADITIGDCWKVDEFIPNINYKNGVSLVLFNSSKTRHIMEYLEERHQMISYPLETAKRFNSTINCPAKRPDERDSFYFDYNMLGFEQAAKKYCKLQYISPVIARYLPGGLKKSVKRIIKRQRSK